jgi:hypothetical protein
MDALGPGVCARTRVAIPNRRQRTRQGVDPPMATTTYDRRPGWLTLAVIFMFAVSFVRIISAINYFQGGDQISDLTNSIFGDNLWVWGVWDLFLAAFGLGAAISLLSGGGFGRLLGYIWAIWVIVQSFLLIRWAPGFALAMMGISSLVIYGLATTSGWRSEKL